MALKKKAIILGFFVYVILILRNGPVLAQPIQHQEMSGQQRTLELEEKQKALRKRIIEKEKAPEVIEEEVPKEEAPAQAAIKTLIKEIKVTDAALISEKELRDIVLPFENRELSLDEMQSVADKITEAYRKKGYITFRAYLPAQKIKNGVLEIKIIEGKMGDLEVKGNHHYKTFLFKKKFHLKNGDFLNYNTLARDLRKMNEQPDRFCRIVLKPGKEAGTTDAILEVEDKLPVHASFTFDNFGSRYIERNRYQIGVKHNNLLGFEDVLDINGNLSQKDSYKYLSGRYVLPATETLNIGAYALWSRLHLQKDAKPLDITGKSTIISLFANQKVVDIENAAMAVNFGFDYKNIFNYQFDEETSRDKMRIVKTGFDLDITDPVGRTLFTNDIGVGLPRFMGGLKSEDPHASRAGSGGKMVKYSANLLRLQKMPFSSTILWINQLQLSPNVLTAVEQFQLGGIANVRGYPPAERVGDQGFATTVEWAFPPYLLPQNIRVPFTKTIFYDALRFVAFYDFGTTRLRKPQPGEKKTSALNDVGCGLRFNVANNISFRMDFAWAIGKKPSDGDREHTWLQVTTAF